MSIAEGDRFEMHLGLKRILGDQVANSLMAHLPPSGWGDVARTRDVDRLENRLDGLETRLSGLEIRMINLETRMSSLESRVESVDTRLEGQSERVDRLGRSISLLIGTIVTAAIGIIVMFVQLNAAIASLR